MFSGVWGAAATGFVAGYVGTGSIQGAVIGTFTAAAFYGIGSNFEQYAGTGKWGETALSGQAFAEKTVLHGLLGGVSTVAGGGKFGHAFSSAGVTHLSGSWIGEIESSMGQVAAAGVLGGTVSAVTGGKFANGAVTASFSYAFSETARPMQDRQQQRHGRPLSVDEKAIFADQFPADVLDSVRIIEGRVPWWLRKDMAAVTLGSRIYIRKGYYVPGTADGVEFLGHELVHVQQYAEGMTIPKYIRESRHGYLNNRYEVEAYSRDRLIRNSFCRTNLQSAGC